jgi:hypothetical protein
MKNLKTTLILATKAAKWFYYQRCGTEVPGFHKECHTEDVVIKTDGVKVDVSGGWHDAGVWGWTFAYLTNEYWTRNNSWFVLGAMQIEKAMRELK